MRVVGLTGGIASGKSTFAALLRARGVPVIDADQVSRAVVGRGSPTLAQIGEVFGPMALLPDGGFNRTWMAERIFDDPEARRRLEAITHPAIRDRMLEEVGRLEKDGHTLAFYDVPLLFEVKLEDALDSVVVVWTPQAVQVERLRARNDLTPAEAQARLSAQLPIDEKARRADVLVPNDGDIASLRARAGPLLRALRAGLSRRLPNQPPARY